jgi:cobalt/nickel transport system ATP-binding protein
MSASTHKHDHTGSHLALAPEVVRISCVRHTYEDGASVHLCGLDFIAHRGGRVAVLGPNGSGKTTMLYHVLGLLRPQEGVVEVFGVAPSERWPEIRRRIGVVLQNVDEQLLAPTVFDDVAFSPRQYGLPEDEVRERVTRALSLLGIQGLADRVPHNLSGGEKRKVALAGALVMDPELLVLDEPFEGLDPTSRTGLLDLLSALARERGMTVVLTTHDIDTVPEFADYAYVLAPGGTIALSGTPEELFASADRLAQGNIKPPILAEPFARLRELDPTAPAPALSVAEAARALTEWKAQA